MSITSTYQQHINAGELTEDPVQKEVVVLLDDLLKRLRDAQPTESGLRRLLPRRLRPEAEAVQGLYLWGGVGRGKTMLMDMFYEALPEHVRIRLHFHRFMHQVHQDLTRLEGTADPLVHIAAEFAVRYQVLCFDEFFVSDIGDAMILGELLGEMFDRGVTLVATSNVEPDRLYEDGLQRRRFLPAIEKLKVHTRIVHVGGDLDYRLRVLEAAEIYHSPLDAEAERNLRRYFTELAPDRSASDVQIEIENRMIRVKELADDVVWFDFAELCEGPRSQNDYIELAREFHAVLLSGVRQFSIRTEDSARRFISLVDEFYDRNVKLIVSAEVPILELYAGKRLQFEFERTQSRLLEMQSHEYLARTHRA
jgi:cell division protein ZapE